MNFVFRKSRSDSVRTKGLKRTMGMMNDDVPEDDLNISSMVQDDDSDSEEVKEEPSKENNEN
jgi:hypothetical protein